MGVDVLKGNAQMFMLMLLWLAAGMFLGQISMALIAVSLLLLKQKGWSYEIFIGFLFILILSDNLENSTDFAKSFKNIYIVLLFLFLLADLRSSNAQLVTTYKLFIPYFILGFICLFFSPVVSTSVQKLISYILLFIVVPSYVVNCYKESGTWFFRTLLYFLFFIIVFGVIARYLWPELSISHGGRLRGVFGNPNGLGIFIILVYILFTVLIGMYEDLMSKHEKIIFYLVFWYVAIASGSRTALMAILLFHVFFFVFNRSKYLGFIFFFLILILTEAFVVYFPRIIVALDLQEFLRLETLEEGSGRTIAWAFAWQNIQQSVFLGKGIAYDEFLMRSNFEFLSRMGHEGGVHNTYLIVWLNTGLVGLICFLRGFFLVFIKASKRSNYAFPAMFAVMLSINFEPWLAASLNPFTILFLVVVTVMGEEIFYTTETKKTDNEEEQEDIQLA